MFYPKLIHFLEVLPPIVSRLREILLRFGCDLLGQSGQVLQRRKLLVCFSLSRGSLGFKTKLGSRVKTWHWLQRWDWVHAHQLLHSFIICLQVRWQLFILQFASAVVSSEKAVVRAMIFCLELANAKVAICTGVFQNLQLTVWTKLNIRLCQFRLCKTWL